jgi:hypothetical protein
MRKVIHLSSGFIVCGTIHSSGQGRNVGVTARGCELVLPEKNGVAEVGPDATFQSLKKNVSGKIFFRTITLFAQLLIFGQTSKSLKLLNLPDETTISQYWGWGWCPPTLAVVTVLKAGDGHSAMNFISNVVR